MLGLRAIEHPDGPLTLIRRMREYLLSGIR